MMGVNVSVDRGNVFPERSEIFETSLSSDIKRTKVLQLFVRMIKFADIHECYHHQCTTRLSIRRFTGRKPSRINTNGGDVQKINLRRQKPTDSEARALFSQIARL
jgi:hypothetical protein